MLGYGYINNLLSNWKRCWLKVLPIKCFLELSHLVLYIATIQLDKVL